MLTLALAHATAAVHAHPEEALAWLAVVAVLAVGLAPHLWRRIFR
jgi:hypothetical protein